jgi:hypothetical protein
MSGSPLPDSRRDAAVINALAQLQLAGKNILTVGSGAALLRLSGNILLNAVATPVNPGAINVDNVIGSFSLPANTFDIAGRGIAISAAGIFGSTANNKRIKIIINPATAVLGATVGTGGVTICDTGVVATNGGGWALSGEVYKYGAAASNTQLGIHSQAQIGAGVAAMLAPSAIAAVESGAILVAIVGNATTVVGDIGLNFFQITAFN